MITVVHDKYIPAVALNDDARMVLGQRYFTGRAKPNYPMPAIPTVVYYYPDAIEMVQPDVINGTERLIFFHDWY